MKLSGLIIPTLVLCFSAGASSLCADEATKAAAPKPSTPAKAIVSKLPVKLQAFFEGVLGKPLTEAQVTQLAQEEYEYKKAAEALREQHKAKRAQLLGVTVAQLDAADSAAKEKMKQEKKAKQTQEDAAAPGAD